MIKNMSQGEALAQKKTEEQGAQKIIINFNGVDCELDFLDRRFYFNEEGNSKTGKVAEDGTLAYTLHKQCNEALQKLKDAAKARAEAAVGGGGGLKQIWDEGLVNIGIGNKTDADAGGATLASAAATAAAAAAEKKIDKVKKQEATIFVALHNHYCSEIVNFIEHLKYQKAELSFSESDEVSIKKAVTQFYLSTTNIEDLPTIIINDKVMKLIQSKTAVLPPR